MPATAPAPSNPAATPPLGRGATTTSERITAGPGTATGTSLRFSHAVAAHAVTNSTNRDA